MRRNLTALCVAAVLLTACGSGGGSTATTLASQSTQEDESGDTQPATETTTAPNSDADAGGGGDGGLPPGGTGTVTIDGETIEAQWVGNCIIDEMFNPHPDALDLVAALDGGLNAFFIEIGYEELSDGLLMRFSPELQRRADDGSYANYAPEATYMLAPDGNWYQDPDGSVYVAIFSGQPHEAESVEAPITLDDGSISGSLPLFLESGESVEVTFDLSYVEAVDCSL